MTRETNIPQIPQVSDGTLQDVVRAIKEIVEVREGRRGDALDEAVTYRDLVALGLVRPLNSGGYGSNVAAPSMPVVAPDTPAATPAPTPAPYAPVATVLDGLDALIAQSPLVRDLRSRIQALETGAWVPEYINDVVTQSNSVARESRTLLSRVNGSISGVQQVLEATDGLKARYTVKVDVNGKVAGFGLAAYPNAEGTTTTEFAIAADRMFIVPSTDYTQEGTPAADSTEMKLWYKPMLDKYYRYSVSGSAWVEITIQTPFFVLTKATIVDGKMSDPGMYVRSAFIQSLAVDKLTAGTVNVEVSLTAAKLLGGQFTAYAWPTAVGGGYYLGSEGLLIGTRDAAVSLNQMVVGRRYKIVFVGTTTAAQFISWGAATGAVNEEFVATSIPTTGYGTGTVALRSFVQLDATTGALYAPGFSIVDGVMNIEQVNVIGTPQLQNGAVSSRSSGSLSADYTVSSASTAAAVTGLSFALDTGGYPVWIHTDFYVRAATGQSVTLELWVGGTKVREDVTIGGFWDSGDGTKANVTYGQYVESPGTGSITIELRAKRSNGSIAGYLTAQSNLFAISTKR